MLASGVNWSVAVLIKVVVLLKPAKLFTYQFTVWLDSSKVVKPVGGIGHSGKADERATLIEGITLVAPIVTVVDDQLPKTLSQLLARTCKSKTPNQPIFHVIIPVAWAIVPGDATADPAAGAILINLHSREL